MKTWEKSPSYTDSFTTQKGKIYDVTDCNVYKQKETSQSNNEYFEDNYFTVFYSKKHISKYKLQ